MEELTRLFREIKPPQKGVFCKPNEEKNSRGDTEQLCQLVLIGQVC